MSLEKARVNIEQAWRRSSRFESNQKIRLLRQQSPTNQSRIAYGKLEGLGANMAFNLIKDKHTKVKGRFGSNLKKKSCQGDREA